MFPQGRDTMYDNTFDSTSPHGMDMNALYDFSSASHMAFAQQHPSPVFEIDYAQQQQHQYGMPTSPSLYGAEERMPSSGLSTASADSSAAGSPQSNPGHGTGANDVEYEWPAAHPSIVGSESYNLSPDFSRYGSTAGLDDASVMAAFDFAQPKGFVGMSSLFLTLSACISYSALLVFLCISIFAVACVAWCIYPASSSHHGTSGALHWLPTLPVCWDPHRLDVTSHLAPLLSYDPPVPHRPPPLHLRPPHVRFLSPGLFPSCHGTSLHVTAKTRPCFFLFHGGCFVGRLRPFCRQDRRLAWTAQNALTRFLI